MARRSAPTYENGLVIPPLERDCVGEGCSVASRRGSCYVDSHHLYFTRAAYKQKGGVYSDFYDDPLNRTRMARCRHNSKDPSSVHKMYNTVDFPKEQTVAEFLKESRILTLLGLKVKAAEIRVGYIIEPAEGYQESLLPASVEKYGVQATTIESMLSTVGSFEVLPEIMMAQSVANLTERFAITDLAMQEYLVAA